jgi:hypothetical protein
MQASQFEATISIYWLQEGSSDVTTAVGRRGSGVSSNRDNWALKQTLIVPSRIPGAAGAIPTISALNMIPSADPEYGVHKLEVRVAGEDPNKPHMYALADHGGPWVPMK